MPDRDKPSPTFSSTTPNPSRQGPPETEPDPSPKVEEELAREFRIAEKWQIGTSIGLAVIGLLALIIYYGQLREMRKATEATKIAADAAKQSADLTRKQMESVGAAVIEMAKGISVYFPVPPSGETRVNLMNSGHVIAHDVHFTLSLSTKGMDRQSSGRSIFSKTEVIPAIAPSMSVDRPDMIYSFELTPQEYAKIMATREYLVAEGNLDYENGFDRRTTESFCYAVIYGAKFGGWAGKCDQAQVQINVARRLARPN